MNEIQISQLTDLRALEDGVYVGRHKDNMWLFLSDGTQKNSKNFICINPQVMHNLLNYKVTHFHNGGARLDNE